MVTPSITPAVNYAAGQDIGVLSGAYTPTEVQQALELGVAAVKLFPAAALGPQYVKALLDPFPYAAIIPVGGVTLELAKEYLAVGAIAVGAGGPLLGDAAHPGGDLDALRDRARAFVKQTSL